jgi:hypothetical protein
MKVVCDAVGCVHHDAESGECGLETIHVSEEGFCREYMSWQ